MVKKDTNKYLLIVIIFIIILFIAFVSFKSATSNENNKPNDNSLLSFEISDLNNSALKKLDLKDMYDYNIYAYMGEVKILVNKKEITLRDALLENRITMDEIIAKANQDVEAGKIKGDMYKDGGSMIYQYHNYTIIKVHNLDGNRDVYIGTTNMTLNDLKI